MTIEVELTGTGRFMGHASNIANYSYTEGSTPLRPGDESGAIGDISIDVMDCTNASILLYKDQFFLEDTFRGAVSGTVESVSGSGDLVTMGGRSRLALLNIEKVLPPRVGSIGDILEAVLNDVGITTDILKTASLPDTVVRAPGHEGDVWVYVKRLAAAHNVEVTIVRNFIVIRPARQRTVEALNLVERNWQLQDIELAQNFDVAYYNYEQVTDGLVYPKGGWTPDVQVYQVGSGETVTFEIPVDFYLTDLTQPVVSDTVSKTYSGPLSRYAVSGNDGLPIPAAQWAAQGGNMSLAIVGDGTVIEVTVTGADFAPLAPYTIGLNDGSSSYSTLRITGSGLGFTREVWTEKTGLTSADTPVVNGGEIDNPAIDTLEDAKQFALFGRRLYSLPTQTYSTSSATFPLISGSIATLFFSTFQEFNDSLDAGYSFTEFNNDYSGLTFEQFTTQLANTVPQGFGEVAGSRIKLEDAVYRIRSTTIDPNLISIEAEYDTLFSDINDFYVVINWGEMDSSWGQVGSTWAEVTNSLFEQKTFADFNTTFGGTTFRDFALIPLREEVCFPA